MLYERFSKFHLLSSANEQLLTYVELSLWCCLCCLSMNNAKIWCTVTEFVSNAVKTTTFTTCKTAVHRIEEVRYRLLTLYTCSEISCTMRAPTDQQTSFLDPSPLEKFRKLNIFEPLNV